MPSLDVRRSISIAAPADIVRRQFADVAHHAETNLHRGVRFEVLNEDGARCHYRQVTRVGPVRITQELELERLDEGPLINTVISGQFAGGTITFDVQPDGADRSTVEARLDAEVRGLDAVVAPLLRRSVRRAFARGLEEDRNDLESGSYEGYTNSDIAPGAVL
ncbi:SRPBCC family protein [Ilumatobacter sp.]|uniref:SRPBCC family protein n=1 Tax=Ilumatobacter sp. TaxID=1967498 RepID=UPI003C374CB4